MKNWFVCTVKYRKIDEKGNSKKITEPYLVDAVSFSEAEARIYQELESLMTGEFIVNDISRSNFVDVFHYEDADVWYKCKVSYVDVDMDTKKEKKVNNYMLVSAHNIKEAYERIEESLSTMIVPFTIPTIIESSFVEVFVYESEESKEQEIPSNLTPLAEIEAKN